MPILELQNVFKYFGGLAAVNNLNLSVENGEILGLIGPNGAGKTTAFNIISGVYKPTSGKIVYHGDDITGVKPYRIAREGIIRTFQFTALFKQYTVLDNVLLGFYLHYQTGFWGNILRTAQYRREEALFREKALHALELAGLIELKNELALNLSYGHQRALALAIALAAEPKLLLLDEPVAGMNSEEVAAMLERIRKLNQEGGITVILVEHNMQAVMNISHRVAVMNFGEKIADGSPDKVVQDPLVIEAYLGS